MGIVAIVIGFFAILGSVGALWLSGHNLIARTVSVAQESQNAVFRSEVDGLLSRIERLENGVEGLQRVIQGGSNRVEKESGSESPAQEGK